MILNLYSKRQKNARGEFPDVFQYDDIPHALRVQIIHIWRDTFGSVQTYPYSSCAAELFALLHDGLCREYGVFQLSNGDDPFERVANFLLSCTEVERVLDVIELSFRLINTSVRNNAHALENTKIKPDAAIEELNKRFREHGVGFAFESGELVRVDSRLLHAEVVKPVLALLREKPFRGANEEFLKAHDHYRHGRYKESLNECLKAFESTLKVICTARRWRFSADSTAKGLIEVCLSNDLLPRFLQTQFSALRALLKSGVPTGRNKLSGHGQGADSVAVPRYFAGYMLHLTATTILLFAEAHAEKR